MRQHISLIFILTGCLCFGQTNEEIAGVYIKKAEKEFNADHIDDAQAHFNKAVTLLDTIKHEGVDRLGTLINYKLGNLMVAKEYAKHYFKISKKEDSLQYEKQLELFVTIEEKLDSISKVNEAQRLAQISREKELRRIDSLKVIWKNKANSLSLSIDGMIPFDRNGFAIYQKGNFFGVLSDKGRIVIPADKYKSVKSFDGYILLLDQVQYPSEILYFNSNTQESYKLPPASSFNRLSTHYGFVTLPRGNHKMVAYPNNSTKTLVFDFKAKGFEVQTYDKDFYKQLKREDKIDSYKNDDSLVKINKIWYYFGGTIAPGIYTLYTEESKRFFGYLFHFDGTILPKSQYGYLGTLHQNKIQTDNGKQTSWINTNAQKVDAPENEAGTYNGNTSVSKLSDGKYQFKQGNTIILGDEKLESLRDFLIENNVSRDDF